MATVHGFPEADMRSDRVAAAAVGVSAFAAVDVVHEALGHGVVAALSPGVQLLSISTVALSTSAGSPAISVAGPFINLITGILALGWFGRGREFGPGALFAWLFATVSLLNGFGYGVYSAALDFGDLANATRGLEPHMAWRIGMGIAGGAGYYISLRIASHLLAARLKRQGTGTSQLMSLIAPAYIAGSVLYLAAAALNPFHELVLLSGVSGGFICMAGLLSVPAMVPPSDLPMPSLLGKANAWRVAALVVAALFIAVLGRGIPLR